jgi:hypothetical protein
MPNRSLCEICYDNYFCLHIICRRYKEIRDKYYYYLYLEDPSEEDKKRLRCCESLYDWIIYDLNNLIDFLLDCEIKDLLPEYHDVFGKY